MVGPGCAGVSSPCAPVLSAHGVPISPSTYYEWITKTPTRRERRDAELIEIITAQREDRKTGKFVQTLGSRKMWIRLRGQGHDVARCTVERIMREQGWEGARYGSKHTTTIGNDSHPRYPDRVDRNFHAPTPNRLWVADFTYVSTWRGFVYVAFVIDAFSRRIVGWRAATSMSTALVLDALEHALFTRAEEGRRNLSGLIAHNDAGAQYTSVAFTHPAHRRRRRSLSRIRRRQPLTRAWLHSAPPGAGWVGTRFLSGLPCRVVRRGSPGTGGW